MANFAGPIEPVQNLGGAVSFPMLAIIEESGQTFNAYTPVSINGTDGGVQVWNGSTITNGIAGFAAVNASNLATTGAGAPQGFTPVLGPGSVVGNYKANPNQPLAVITPSLVPINDGTIQFFVAGLATVFVGKVGTTGSAIATTNQMVGAQFGMTLDTNGYWYVDTAKTGASAVLQVSQLDPRDAVGTVGGRLWFTILATSQQVQA
jgi:hypothetical protein